MFQTLNLRSPATNHPILPRIPSNTTKSRRCLFACYAIDERADQQHGRVDLESDCVEVLDVKFQSLKDCKLGISRYPDFNYDAEGGFGIGTASLSRSGSYRDFAVEFDIGSLYIPPLTSKNTRFLGLPLPPLLKIDILPELLSGTIEEDTGKVNLAFKAKFLFSIGTLYEAPPLIVETILTSEEVKGKIRGGKGERLDKEGKCRLVGLATVCRIDDAFMNSFLQLPTECLADLKAKIVISREQKHELEEGSS